MKNYSKRINNLRNRRMDTTFKKAILSDSFSQTNYNESIKYVLESMEPVKAEYTKNTCSACERVQNAIKQKLDNSGYSVEFKYQGSVPLNTHIKLYSDMDQLVITNRYESLERPQIPQYPYSGNPTDDLLRIRNIIVSTISEKIPSIEIDNSGAKSISLSGGTLNRNIDVIPANWYRSNKYVETNDQDYMRIQILDKNKKNRITNFPFMFIWWINHKDSKVNGNLKKLIRFIKTLRADFNEENKEQIGISSYDIFLIII